MPNHYTTILTVTAPDPANAQSLLDFVEKYTNLDGYDAVSPPGELDFFGQPIAERLTEPCLSHAFHPMPLEYKGTVEGTNRETAADGKTWYDWARENWGTKWGTYDEYHMVSDDRIVITMMSAWCPPYRLFERLGKMYPNLNFEANGYDEGNDELSYFWLDENGSLDEMNLGEWRSWDDDDEDYIEHVDPSSGVIREPI